ncbi:flagellar assembly protein FliH [Psychrobacillus psychrotolerans]|uniref:Flagellar assembly protein FliH n=1 Tax=Psychrobacillus psychrotolerans TaxID=126156 RepID=A0A1I5WEL7_9BACI|nr:flagellar assembly protein FliH [Psychrobacillus psychrotolerans]SFQ18101.1 flagellar assembly protein FliH [Psychrobacillus psychrotolerans]
MTSLSKIFRNVYLSESKENTKPIQIRNLYVQEMMNTDEPLTIDVLTQERSKMLEQVNQEIAEKRALLTKDIEETKQYVENQLNAWEEEKIVYQQQAYDEAFIQGLEEGRLKAQADMQNSLKLANETMKIAHENAANYLQQQEQVILELALRTAERIIAKKLEDNEELFLSIVKRGLKEAREMKVIKLYVSPTYFELVSNNREELSSIFPVDVPFMVFVDEDMNETDCYIETNHGRIVVSIDEQVQELRRKLVDILDNME